jgi:hypothetical protein
MSRAPRWALLATAVGGVLLLAYLVAWQGLSRFDVGRSDFTAIYMGGTLLREGHGAQLYDERVQAPVHATLIAAGDHEGNLPYVNPPGAALAVLPVTLLDLPTAYRVWSLLQLVLIGLGVAAAVRAAPWPRSTPRSTRLAAWAVSTAGAGAVSTLLLGQWDGVLTLAVGMAYASWRRDRPATAAVWLTAVAVVAKPHLFLGVAAFLLMRRERRALVAAGATAGALALVSLALVGPHGMADFARISLTGADRWPLAGLLGFAGLFGSWMGQVALAHALAALGSVAAVVGCGVLGARSRDPGKFETALAGTLALSLVASPHLLHHDLALLAPAAAWMLGRAASRDRGVTAWPGVATRRVLMLWVALNCAAALDFGNGSSAPPGRVVPLVLAALGIAALRVVPAPRRAPLYSGRGSGVGGVVDQS